MAKAMAVILALLVPLGFVYAQAMCPEDVTLREGTIFDWNSGMAKGVDGSVFTIIYNNEYNRREIWLYKITPDGECAWTEPVVICSGDTQKYDYNIFTYNESSIYVSWKENTVPLITKVDLHGQPCWNPAIRSMFPVGALYTIYCSDNNDGLYGFCGLNSNNGNVDILAQHMDAAGNCQYPDYGVFITDDFRNESPSFAEVNSDGSVFVAVNISTSNSYYIKLMYLGSDLLLRWDKYLQASPQPELNRYILSICRYESEYYLVWTEESSSSSEIYYNRIDLQGNLMYLSAIPILYQSCLYGSAISSDGDLLICFRTRSTIQYYIRRINRDGELVWNTDVSLPPETSSVRIARAENDTLDLIINRYDSDAQSNSYYLQQCNADGELALHGFGIPLKENLLSLDNSGLIYNHNYFFIWKQARNDDKGLYSEVYSPDGALIGQPCHKLREVLNSYGYLWVLQNRDDDVLAIWDDYRIPHTNRIYYQIVNSDGSIEMDEQGSLLFALPGYPEHITSVHLDNGYTWVFADCRDMNRGCIFVQAISPNGELLYEEYDHILMGQPGYLIGNIMAYAEGDAIFLAWSRWNYSTGMKAYIQKIVNGQPQWGEEGKIITSCNADQNIAECPLLFKDGFLVLRSDSDYYPYALTQYDLWVYHFDENGDISPGWDPNGLRIGTIVPISELEFYFNAEVCDDVLLVCYQDRFLPYLEYLYYLVDSAGNIQEGENSLFPRDYHQYYLDIDVSSGFAYAARLYSNQTLSYAIGFGKNEYSRNT